MSPSKRKSRSTGSERSAVTRLIFLENRSFINCVAARVRYSSMRFLIRRSWSADLSKWGLKLREMATLESSSRRKKGFSASA